MSAYVYILHLKKSNRYYVGSTSNLPRRFMQHSQGQTATTRRNCEFELVFSQKADSIEIARGAERRIKSWKRSDFIEKIISEGRISFLDDVGH